MMQEGQLRVTQDDVASAVARNLRGREAFLGFAKHLLIHPVHLCVLTFPVMMQAFGAYTTEYPALGFWANTALLLPRYAIYFAGMLTLYPVLMPALMRRNIPYIWAFLVPWALLTAALAGAMELLVPPELGVLPQPWRYLRQLALQVPSSLLVSYIFEREIRTRVGEVAALVPFWRRVRAGDLAPQPVHAAPMVREPEAEADPPAGYAAALLDPRLAGRLLSLQAQNQYVHVTTDLGSKLLRRTFTAALADLPADAGVRVHRSWWVSRAELAGLRLCDGGKMLRGEHGRSYPVSRTNRPEVRAALGLAPVADEEE